MSSGFLSSLKYFIDNNQKIYFARGEVQEIYWIKDYGPGCEVKLSTHPFQGYLCNAQLGGQFYSNTGNQQSHKYPKVGDQVIVELIEGDPAGYCVVTSSASHTRLAPQTEIGDIDVQNIQSDTEVNLVQKVITEVGTSWALYLRAGSKFLLKNDNKQNIIMEDDHITLETNTKKIKISDTEVLVETKSGKSMSISDVAIKASCGSSVIQMTDAAISITTGGALSFDSTGAISLKAPAISMVSTAISLTAPSVLLGPAPANPLMVMVSGVPQPSTSILGS